MTARPSSVGRHHIDRVLRAAAERLAKRGDLVDGFFRLMHDEGGAEPAALPSERPTECARTLRRARAL